MNLVDRVIGYFSPERGAARARARHLIRAYDGASQGRRANAWKANRVSVNSEIQYALVSLRDRARDLVRNDPWCARMLDIMPAHVVGTGIRPVSNTGRDGIDRRVTELWEEWANSADVMGHLNFYAIQVLAVRSMIESGEIACRFIDQPLKNDGSIPLKLQLLEADFIDHFRNGLYGGSGISEGLPGDVERTRLGVALGEYDVWKGLWLWPYHPGEVDTINQVALASKFVPRDDLMHVFKSLRPGQVRGVSWLAPIITNARELSDFLDAVNVKARVEACFSAFITNDDQSSPVMDANYTDAVTGSVGGDPNFPSSSITTMAPGMLKELRAGQDVKFAQPTTNTQIDPMLLHNLRAMAAGVGCTYDQATGDLTGANYSSLRAGKIDFWRLIGQLQLHTVIPQLCQPTWDRFISRAVLAGRLKPRPGGYKCEWVVPAREAINPKEDLEAEKNEVRAGRVTPQQFIASKGNNWRRVLSEFKSFNKESDQLGLAFDIDVRKVDQHGRQPPAQSQPLDPEDRQGDSDDDSGANDGDET